jgi:hypothetical protein
MTEGEVLTFYLPFGFGAFVAATILIVRLMWSL